jgi:hypothetical protein
MTVAAGLLLIFKLPFNYLHLIYVEQGLGQGLHFTYLGPSLTYKSFQKNASQRWPFLPVLETDLASVHSVNCQRYTQSFDF